MSIYWLDRIKYRIWQFKQVIFPKLDLLKWNQVLLNLEKPLREKLGELKKSEKAHVLRVYEAIEQDQSLDVSLRVELMKLALLHDIGKSICRHTIFFKVAKVFLPFANTRHCVEGARFLKKSGVDRSIVKRVLRHHSLCPADPLLRKFQEYDDRL